MRATRSLIALLLVLFVCLPAVGQSDNADRDADLETVMQSFNNLQQSMQNAGGITEDHRPFMQELLEQAHDFNDQWPEDEQGIAMELQLAIWLKDDAAVDRLFMTMLELQPANAALARPWVQYFALYGGDDAEAKIDSIHDRLFMLVTAMDTDDVDVGTRWASFFGQRDRDRLRQIYEALAVQRPDDGRVGLLWANELKGTARFAEALAAIDALDQDTQQSAEAILLRAQCLFAEEQIEASFVYFDQLTEAKLSELSVSEQGQYNLTLETKTRARDVYPLEIAARARDAETGTLPQAVIITDRGRIVVELFEDDAPNHVANFISLADDDFYDGLTMHRVIPTFMSQMGDPRSTIAEPLPPATNGTDGPGYTIADEHTADLDYRNLFTGSLSMANYPNQPNTGASQFFITHQPTSHLNGVHTVFGRVIDGLDVVRASEVNDMIVSVDVTRRRDHEYLP